MRSTMPWFWELEGLRSRDIDYKSVCAWLTQETRTTVGMEGLFLSVANRRRIWAVCERLAALYSRRLELKPGTEACESAMVIRDQSVVGTLQAAGQARPPLEMETRIRLVESQWVYSWHEVDGQCAMMEAFFDYEGFLVGMAVDFGNGRRVLGRDGSGDEGGTRDNRPRLERVRIKTRSWIVGFMLHTSLVPDGDGDTIRMGVRGVTVGFCGVVTWSLC